MMSLEMWAGQRVQDFFNGCNWRGEPPKLPPRTPPDQDGLETESLTEIDWFSIKVQDFIGFSNWKGSPLTPTRLKAKTPLPKTAQPVLSLAVSVQAFFEDIPWRGNPLNPLDLKPEMPKKKSSLGEIPQTDDDWTITDLSDLL